MASSAAIPDPEELGITILYEGKPSTVDIICVHGLNSNPNQCWRKGDVLWLRDLLPGETELKNTRIATFGYNSKILDEASRARVTDHATKLLLRLLAMRKDEEAKERPIIFVCHSLGGIVVKQALVIAQQTPRYRNIQMSTTGIVFLGTPHQGSKLASFGQTMAKVAKVAFKNPKTHLLKTLEKNSEELLDLSVQFSNLHDQFRIVSCFETRDTILSKGLFQKTEMVVPESSAKLAIQEEILVAMDTDHRNICKFSGVKDPGYIDVKDMIVELVGKAPSVAKERFKPAVGLSLNSVSLSHLSLTPDLPPQTKTLFGRETELESLHTYFTSLREVRKVAVLWGLGGMGKSQLALKYQEQHQPPYTSVFWISSQTEEDIVISFQKIVSSLLCAICQLFPEISEQYIAQSLGIRNVGVLTEALRTTKDAHMVINSLKAFLSKKDNRNWLLVFDSWDSSDNVDLRLLFPPNIYGDIVVTTRQKDYENLGLSQEVTGIGIGAAAELLMNRTLQGTSQGPGIGKNQDLQDAENLALKLGGVPLALEQAETYMFSTQTRIREYLILLKKNSEKILGHRPTEFEWAYDKNEPVFQTLEITFSALSTYPDACNLLSFLAFLNPSHITKEVFNKFMSGEIFLQPLSNQVGQSLEAIQILFTDESRFGQAKATLVRFCLISSKVLSTQGLWKIDIHPLVHRWSRLRLGIEKQQELSISVAFSLAVMVRIKGKSTPTHLLLAQRLSPHIDFSLEQLYSRKVFDETDTPSKPWFEVIQFTIENFASFYWKGKRHNEAAQLYQLILGGLNLCEDTSEDGMIRLSNTSESLGRVLWESGELVRAEDFVKRAVDVKAEIFGWESESVVETANLLKKIQERRSHIAMMEENSRNAVSSPKTLLGRDQPDQPDQPNQPDEHYHVEMLDEESVLYISIVKSIELASTCNEWLQDI